MVHEFDAVITRLPGKIKWPVVFVPFDVTGVFGTKGRVNVKGTVDGHPFTGTLLPSNNGHYQVMNEVIRTAVRKDEGDMVRVVLERDDSPREIEVPWDVMEALEAEPGLLEAFQGMPAYIRREELNKIESAKKPETRLKRLGALVDRLRA